MSPTPEQVALIKSRIESVPRNPNPSGYKPMPTPDHDPLKAIEENDAPGVETPEHPAMFIEGVHFDVYDYFGIIPMRADPANNKFLKRISDWALDGGVDINTALKKLAVLEIKLGRSSMGDDRIHKLYSWIKITNQ